jgi:hypothetical protein
MPSQQGRGRDEERVPAGARGLAAVKKSRSMGVIAGRGVRRRSIASSCRNTRISRSLESFDQTRRASNWRTCRSAR